MYKPRDFHKGCPVCCAVSKSLTKKKCDICGAELIVLDTGNNSSEYNGKKLKWEFQKRKDKNDRN